MDCFPAIGQTHKLNAQHLGHNNHHPYHKDCYTSRDEQCRFCRDFIKRSQSGITIPLFIQITPCYHGLVKEEQQIQNRRSQKYHCPLPPVRHIFRPLGKGILYRIRSVNVDPDLDCLRISIIIFLQNFTDCTLSNIGIGLINHFRRTVINKLLMRHHSTAFRFCKCFHHFKNPLSVRTFGFHIAIILNLIPHCLGDQITHIGILGTIILPVIHIFVIIVSKIFCRPFNVCTKLPVKRPIRYIFFQILIFHGFITVHHNIISVYWHPVFIHTVCNLTDLCLLQGIQFIDRLIP